MTKKQIRNIIIILAMSIIIAIILLLVMLNIKKNNVIEYDPPSTSDETDYEEELEASIQKVASENDFYTVQTIMQNYFLYAEVKNADIVYSILDTSYIQQKNITKENVLENIKNNIVNSKNYDIKEMYVRDSINQPIFYTYGVATENDKEVQLYYSIYIDRTNISYAIKPISKEEYEQLVTDKKKEENKPVTKTEYNKLKTMSLSNEEIAKRYFQDYINKAIYHTKEAYASLDENYKKKRFGTIEEYQKYLLNNKDELISLDIKGIKSIEDFKTEEEYMNYVNNLVTKNMRQYSLNEQGDKKECICIDDYGNYYIFNITSAMQYTLLLDTYTIDMPQFTQKYTAAKDEQKVLLNIQKFFEAINNKDYKYAYSKLDGNYKETNFKTQADFENYVKQNFFAKNSLTAGSVTRQENVYAYEINITDKMQKDTKTIKKTFVMQLKEGTDFVMSFSK